MDSPAPRDSPSSGLDARLRDWLGGRILAKTVLPLFYNSDLIPPGVSTTVIALTSGLVAGAITGLALVWIVRGPDKV